MMTAFINSLSALKTPRVCVNKDISSPPLPICGASSLTAGDGFLLSLPAAVVAVVEILLTGGGTFGGLAEILLLFAAVGALFTLSVRAACDSVCLAQPADKTIAVKIKMMTGAIVIFFLIIVFILKK
jgi:hypothetical protein